MDLLEWKGRYMLPMGTHPNVMRPKLIEFTEAIDIKYLTNYPERINHMADISHHMADYVIQNMERIKILKPAEINALKSDFVQLYKIPWGNSQIPSIFRILKQ